MSKLDTVCTNCNKEVSVDSFTKYNMRELQNPHTYYKFKCPECGVRVQTEDTPTNGVSTKKSKPRRATKRIPGTDQFVTGDIGWSYVPDDLLQKLEEERLIREANDKESEEGLCEADGITKETLD